MADVTNMFLDRDCVKNLRTAINVFAMTFNTHEAVVKVLKLLLEKTDTI